ncbi:hypothetical protein PFISCL1PPCAC_4162 [Pristionchus fissidentatus]|uniref:Uncharacterized protein n=1 Tax=Pristionchus fissidentatus TaxID=1538716 RepID=A0AAV5V2Z7_9BILA|nr:hypothetical protein PFISCL1PPCAC_4162 [Pristionchus fissidentatus]
MLASTAILTLATSIFYAQALTCRHNVITTMKQTGAVNAVPLRVYFDECEQGLDRCGTIATVDEEAFLMLDGKWPRYLGAYAHGFSYRGAFCLSQKDCNNIQASTNATCSGKTNCCCETDNCAEFVSIEY